MMYHSPTIKIYIILKIGENMAKRLILLLYFFFIANGLFAQSNKERVSIISLRTSGGVFVEEVSKSQTDDITALSDVAITSSNEKAPVIVGTTNYLYAIYEYTPSQGGPTKIRIKISTNNGGSWSDWDEIYTTTGKSIGLPYAYISGSKLYIVFHYLYNSTDTDIYYCSYTIGTSPSNLVSSVIDNSGANTFRPAIIVNSSNIYVGYIDGNVNKFKINYSSNNGSSWSTIFTSSQAFSYPSTLLRVDGTYWGSSNMFVYNTKISNTDQIVVVSRTGTTTWTDLLVTSTSGNKSGPSIGVYGNNWIVAFQGTSNNVKYFYKLGSGSVSSEYTLSSNATFPTIEIGESGYIVCTYIKDQKVFMKNSGIAQLPSWSSENALYNESIVPSTDDFMAIHPDYSNKGVVFASPYSSNDYDVYFAGFGSTQTCTLSINPTQKTMPASGGTFTLSIVTNCNWTAQDNASWITITPTSGNGNGSITVTVDANTSINSRTGTVTVTAGSESITCTITQSGMDQTLVINPDVYNAPSANAGSFTISVASNLQWTASDNASWITITPTSGNGNGTITVNYDANTTSAPRTGTVTVQGGIISVYCTINQPGVESNLVITPTQYTAPNNTGGTFPVTVTSNVSWTVQTSDPSWLTANPTSGTNNGNFTVTYATNNTTTTKTGIVTVSGGGVERKCTVSVPGVPPVASVPLSIVAPSQVTTGSEFWIDIKIGSASNPVIDLKVISFEFNFQQASLLQYLTYEIGSFLTGANANVIPDQANGKISASVYKTSGGNSGEGVVIKLKFKVSSSAPANSSVNYSFTNILANNVSGNTIPILPQTASSQIISGLLVWPGDTNNDNTVNIIDINPIIINFNAEGPVRPNASPAWVGQLCPPWTPQSRTYIDANGNGRIEITDINMVIINFNKNHTLSNTGSKIKITENPLNNPPLLAISNVPNAFPGTNFEITIAIGSQALPVTNVQVLSFELHYSNPQSLTYLGDTIGNFFTSPSKLVIVDSTQGIISTSVYQISGGNSGSGNVIKFRFRVKENTSFNTIFNFSFQNVQANRVGGEVQPLNPLGILVPVPVELTSFTGTATEGLVMLNWTTATEINNKGFEIERRSLGNEWQKIGFVQGFGTTTEPRQYTFTDATLPGDGEYEYRLKQLDLNGAFEYSTTISVKAIVSPDKFILYQNYPNPFNPTTQISYSLPKACNVQLILYDAIGNVAGYIYEGYQNAGYHSINFDASHLTNGVYYYQLNAGDFVQVKKLVLMK